MFFAKGRKGGEGANVCVFFFFWGGGEEGGFW